MPSFDTSTVAGALGVLCFAVGVYAYVVLGWRFGDSNSLGTVLGVAAVVVAVALTVLRR